MSLEILASTSHVIANLSENFPPDSWSDPNKCQEGNNKNFQCAYPGCTREFTSKRNLVDHCRGHHQGTKPHTCTFPSCGKSFLRPAHLLIHTRIHTGEKPFVCPFEGCGKRWNQKSALKQHMRSHTGEKPFVCTVPGCSKKFSTSSSCKRHILTHGKNGESTPQNSPPGSPRSPPQKRVGVYWEEPSFKRHAVCPMNTDRPVVYQEPKVDLMSVNFLLN